MNNRKIRVIASDLDGTLLNGDHVLDQHTYDVIKKAQKAGYRFITVTGRDYTMTLDAFRGLDLQCDYILASGAETRNAKGEVIQRRPLSQEKVEHTVRQLVSFHRALNYNTANKNYRVGSEAEVRNSLLYEVKNFYVRKTIDLSDKKVVEKFVEKILARTTIVSSLQDIMDPIYKISVSDTDLKIVEDMKAAVADVPGLAVASSYPNNLEITDVKAQKGPVLKEFITKLGYTMDEVILFGDSMNDYSMFEMDYGYTVAMENAMPQLKKMAKRIAPSNLDHGVAAVIEELLKGNL